MATSVDVVDLLNHIYDTYNVVTKNIRSDNSTIFTKAATMVPSITWDFTPTYSSSSNGKLERRHRELARHLRLSFLRDNVTDSPTLSTWTTYVTIAASRVNTLAISDASGLSPRDLIYDFPATNPLTNEPYLDIENKHLLWRSHCERSASRSSSATPTATTKYHLTEGSQVLLRQQHPHKHEPRWEGPFEIAKILGDNRFVLNTGQHVHSKNIKLLIDLPDDASSDIINPDSHVVLDQDTD
ncbi:hypothetical protein FOZ63_015741 [Perkinsus olseni]|uniref:Integrase catalytic domain-containing protein n=1 Tax=Perkinsus olseni TaxID=32597 RepID=A0A7J6UC04_PEROL|nr:hypothetical protein FOZ63_015741 [Perkinsus olseni]